MRNDMGRVVIERPRRGSSHKGAKIRDFGGRINDEGDYDGLTRLPCSREKIYGYSRNTLEKEFTDLLGPLRRYLRKNVGRPWDKVYGEACASLRSGGWGVQHVFESHFLDEVARDVLMDENGALSRPGYHSFYSRLYVHPRTGLLCMHVRR